MFPRVIAYTTLPKSPPGPASIRTMLSPKDEIGVSCDTETNGAALKFETSPASIDTVPRFTLSA